MRQLCSRKATFSQILKLGLALAVGFSAPVFGATKFDYIKAGKADVDNVRIDGNTVSTLNTNGDMTFTPNGTGKINLSVAPTLPSLTATTVPYLDSAKKLTSSAVTPTELGYLSGATSNIQTQLTSLVAGTTPTSPNAIFNCSVAASISSNNLVLTLNDGAGATPSAGSPCKVSFRNATAATGAYDPVSLAGALSITANATNGTLGCANLATCTLYVYAIDNGSSFKLGVINGSTIDEGTRQSSANLGGTANNYGQLYTNVAVANLGVRLIGRVTATRGTNTWATINEVANVPFVHKSYIFTKTSAATTTPASDRYPAYSSDNFLDLPAGTWRLFGEAYFGNDGTTPGYSNVDVLWAAANGTGTSSSPADISTASGLTVLTTQTNFTGGNVSGSNFYVKASDIIVTTVFGSTLVFLDTYSTQTTSSHARHTVYLNAIRLDQ